MENYYTEDLLEVGVDEVARGCLAGPVFSAAVIWPKEVDEDLRIFEKQIKDSKKLSRAKRNELRHFIEEVAIDYSVAYIDETIIDYKNILNATYMAMHEAINRLNTTPELILVDGKSFKPYYEDNVKMDNLVEHICIKGGDNKYISIACASILAKEYHDDYIKNLCAQEPELNRYDWSNNMCYGTLKHIGAIKEYGLTKYHRKTFGICREYVK
jgi:ribonuclease HII